MNEINFDEVIDELESCTMVTAVLTREETEEIFKKKNRTPMNENIEPDDSYVQGELQFLFEKDLSDVQEILVYPVYKDEDSLVNGDFVVAPDRYFNDEVISKAREFAEKSTEREKEEI